MASVPVTIIGTMTGKDGSENVTITGMASLSGLGVGGGPIEGGPVDPGYGIPEGGRPTHPIYWPRPGHPEQPIYLPPGIWPNPPEGQAPMPMPPIHIPPPSGVTGPPLEVKIVWTPENQWQVVLVPTGDRPHPAPSAQPAGRRG